MFPPHFDFLRKQPKRERLTLTLRVAIALNKNVLTFFILCDIQSRKPFWSVSCSQHVNLFQRPHVTNNATLYTPGLTAFPAGELPVFTQKRIQNSLQVL